jgi:transmembrane sensor
VNIREAAAHWVVRINDPDATEADFSAWQVWLGADPAHREAYEALESSWSRATQMPRSLLPTSGLVGKVKRREREGSRRPYAIAATVLIAFCAGLVFWLKHRTPVLETATAEQRSLRLKDGSRVELAGESRLIVDLNAHVRALRLEQGEAYFDVAQDATRPFVVHVGAHEVRALGTAFNIEKNFDRAVVTVAQGEVQIAGVGPPLVLRAAEQAEVKERDVRKLAAVDPQAATAWRDGRLEYLREELHYVIDDVNRYVERKIVVSDQELAHLEFTGTVFLDHLDEWLATLPGSFPVAVVERGGKRELVRARK